MTFHNASKPAMNWHRFKKLGISTSLLLMLFVLISSCSKTTTSSATQYGTISLQFQSQIAGHNIDTIGKFYTDSLGRRISLNLAQFYFCGVILHQANGATYVVPGVYGLNTLQSGSISLGQVPVGDYTSITVNIGVDAAANAVSSAGYPATNPLSPQSPPMWFGNTVQGFEFVNIQGSVDTTVNGTGTGNKIIPISYQVGTNALLRSITLTGQTLTIGLNQNLNVNFVCDYGKLLSVVNFKTNPSATPFTSNSAVATAIANQEQAFLRYK